MAGILFTSIPTHTYTHRQTDTHTHTQTNCNETMTPPRFSGGVKKVKSITKVSLLCVLDSSLNLFTFKLHLVYKKNVFFTRYYINRLRKDIQNTDTSIFELLLAYKNSISITLL